MENLEVTSFYKYIKLASPKKFQKAHQQYCSRLGIKGKVLVAKEGINGSISGTNTQINRYKKNLFRNPLFKGMVFKDTLAEGHPFRRMLVRLRPEIVSFSKKVDLRNRAKHVSPRLLNKWIERQQVILLDVRNDYESRIGKFADALTPNIENFRDFPGAVNQLKKFKQRKIVTYCTGGIRCEKASAFLREQGFESVFQLKDGILNYIRQYPDTHFQGRCFVFDSRLSVPSGTKNQKITTCDFCHVPSFTYINCRNVMCDKLFICCDNCMQTFNNTCSKRCRNLIS